MAAEENGAGFVQNLFAGWLAGIGQVIVGQPFDAVKVRLQTSQRYSNSLQCLREITRNDGICSFYRGSSSPLLGVGLISAVQFSSKEYFFNYGAFCSGVLSGTIGSVFICPFEALRIKMQLSSQKLTLWRTIKSIGVVGCYRGFASTLLRESLGMGCYFWTYERGTELIGDSPYSPFVAGGVAGMAYWSSIYPIDVVKTCMQSCTSLSCYSYPKIIRHLWKTNGYFRGIGPCLLRAVPVNAVAFCIYEFAQKKISPFE